jgi:molybdopterin converting factor small subunit
MGVAPKAGDAPTPSIQPSGCTLELLGPARLIAGIRSVKLDVRSETPVGQVIAMLAEACPSLKGPVVHAERDRLTSGYVLNRNGREFLVGADAQISPGDSLLLLSSTAGG